FPVAAGGVRRPGRAVDERRRTVPSGGAHWPGKCAGTRTGSRSAARTVDLAGTATQTMTPASTEVDAVVIGAGPNGLVASIALADAGWDVLLVEANPTVGGAVRTA